MHKYQKIILKFKSNKKSYEYSIFLNSKQKNRKIEILYSNLVYSYKYYTK